MNRLLYSLSALIMGDKFRQISSLLDQDQNV